MLGDEINSEHATKILAFGQNGQPEKVTTQGVQLGPKGKLLSNILNTLESNVTTMEFEPKGELLSTNFNTSNAFINEPLVYTVELFNGLIDLGGHAHASMPMQNVECSVDNAVNNVRLPSPLPSNTKTLPLSDIMNQGRWFSLVVETRETSGLPDISWENLGFNPVTTDFMYVMKFSGDGEFLSGGLQRFGNIELNPTSCVLNYGQGIIEGLKAHKKHDNSIVLFRPEENGLRMKIGADRMCMPAPTVEQFVEAVKVTVLANRRWVPPPHKGFLHIRPLLMGTGPVLSLTPAPEFTFFIFVTPVGNYFEGGSKQLSLVVEEEIHRAVPGGVGSVKAIGNYAVVLKALIEAKADGFSEVLYLDSVYNKYLEEVSTANIFVVKIWLVTRVLMLHDQVEERLVSVDELLDADEVFCTGNAICLLPVGSITYMGRS
nr:branched-chain-amino-acid aminotransferase 5, chloroplastic [Quercus suber]